MAEESNNNEVFRVMNSLGDKLLSQLITEIQSQDLIASRTLINSLNYRVVEVIRFIETKLEMRGIDYSLAAFNGRKPGKQPPISKIKEWCTYKGIPQSKAWPIAKSIGRYGIPPKNVLRNILKSDTIRKFEEDIKEAYAEQLRKEIFNIIKE